MFQQKVLLLEQEGQQIAIQPGDKVHVKSSRFSEVFTDGVVVMLHSSGVTVRYGHRETFGWSLFRSNEKFVHLDDVGDVLFFPNPLKIGDSD